MIASARSHPRALGALLGGAVAAGCVLVAVNGQPEASIVPPEFGLPDPPRPGLVVPAPRPLPATGPEARWAPVLKRVAARRAPSRVAPVVAEIATTTPEGTTGIVLILGRKQDAAGRLWVRVRLPVLPNNTTGWVPRSALGGYGVVRTRLVVDLERLTATLIRGRRAVFQAPVGVGATATPTPRGKFYVRNRLAGFGSPFYGPLAFGTSARSEVMTDWPAGGFVGIHGTDRPELIPGRVSHGCIRLRNADIVTLGRLMPVGTPLTIR